MVKQKKRILYVHKHKRSFIDRDYQMLSKHFQVTSFFFNWKTLVTLPVKILKHDIVFVWFVSYHAFFSMILSKLFSKHIVVVTGGYDVAGEKEISYGLMRNRFLKWMVGLVLKHSDQILAVSEFNKKEIIKHFGLQEKIKMIYNSVNAASFYPDESIQKQAIVLTVGFIKKETVKRKGLSTFVRAAKHVPEARFLLVGKAEHDGSMEQLQSIASNNVEFTGFISDDDLLRLYQKAKVYCQLSYYESFGMTPAEAMLCECIPVVTSQGALPEVAGKTGFFTPYGSVEETAQAIKKALNADEKLGKDARNRIINKFSAEYREQELIDAIKGLV